VETRRVVGDVVGCETASFAYLCWHGFRSGLQSSDSLHEADVKI
jgi:hypothetical protein